MIVDAIDMSKRIIEPEPAPLFVSLPKVIRFLIISSALIFATGCVAVNEYFVSKPAVDADETYITQNGVIKLSSAVIVVRPANAILKRSSEGLLLPFVHYEPEEYTFNSSYYKGGPLTSVNYFILEIIISPADNHVVFIPENIILKTQEGREIRPVSYQKRTIQRGWYSVYYPKYFAELCQQEEEKDRDIGEPVQLSGKNDICLAIKYQLTPPDPRTSFSVQIDDFNLNERKINIPTIKFAPGSYRFNRA